MNYRKQRNINTVMETFGVMNVTVEDLQMKSMLAKDLQKPGVQLKKNLYHHLIPPFHL